MSEALVIVDIFDTTLRDGAQSLPEENQFPNHSKPEIANQIAQLGVGVIEAGFPITYSDAEEVREVAKSVGVTSYPCATWRNGKSIHSAPNGNQAPVIAGLSRTLPNDIDAAWDAVNGAFYPRIHTFISTDPEHMAKKFDGKTPDEVLVMGQTAVRHARSLVDEHPDATVEFSAEAASTTDWDYLERVIKMATDEGADIVNLPDTVGQRNPFWMEKFYDRAIRWAHQTNPNIVISAHNHNDLGLATANSLSLVSAAANYANEQEQEISVQIETAVCGLGERAGNADIFPVIAGLYKFSDDMPSDIEWRFNPHGSVRVANAVMSFAGLQVHRQSPIVGRDINRHRSGIHSDGIIKGGHQIYTPFDPRFWGHEQDAVHEEGRYQGRAGRQAISGS